MPKSKDIFQTKGRHEEIKMNCQGKSSTNAVSEESLQKADEMARSGETDFRK
jgi:hypothetical protein